MSLGDHILALAPEAANIIKAELGIGDPEISALTGDDSIPFQGPDAQLEQMVSVTEQGDSSVLPKEQIREIWIGEHPDLGDLKARLPVWDPAYDRLQMRRVAHALVPEFADAITEHVPGMGPKVTHRGELSTADAYPKGHLWERSLQEYNGLAWKDTGAAGEGFFTKVCELAVATLYHHSDIAILSGGAVQCDINEAFIRDLIDGNLSKRIKVTDGSDGGCSSTAWDWRLHLLPLPAPARSEQVVVDRDPSWSGSRGANMSSGGGVIKICGSMVKRCAKVDYHTWWACQLYWRAKDTGSIWYMFMAIMCMRAATSDIVRIAAVILHEMGHSSGAGRHCDNGCCHDRAELFFQHALWAKYGLPKSSGGADRFSSEEWSGSASGSTSCGSAVFEVNTTHCALLKLEHAVVQEVELDSSCNGGTPTSSPFERYEFFTPTASFPELVGTASACV